MTAGFAFAVPGSVVEVARMGNGDAVFQKANIRQGAPAGKESAHAFHRILKKSEAQKTDGSSPLVDKKTDPFNSKLFKKLQKEIQNGVVDIKDLFAFLHQLMQVGMISPNQLKSLLVNKVIPALEKGGRDFQNLAKLLKEAVEPSGKPTALGKNGPGEFEKNTVKPSLLEQGHEQEEPLDTELTFKDIKGEEKDASILLQRMTKDLKMGENPGELDAFSASLKPGKTNGKIESNSLDRLFEHVPKGQVDGNHVKEWIEALLASKSESEEVGKTRKFDAQGAKIGSVGAASMGKVGHDLVPLNELDLSAPKVPVVEQVVRAMNFSHRDGQYTMRIALKPPQLGNIDVSLTVRGHHVQANFSVESPVTHELLTHQLPELRALLAQQGLTMKEVSVQVGGGNPQGFRPFGESSQKFSGQGNRNSRDFAAIKEIHEDNSEGFRLSRVRHEILMTPLDRINVFV